jgi:asparagine synthase (glutamine-hydrolysing)
LLQLRNDKQQIIQQWDFSPQCHSKKTNLIFTIHHQDIVDTYQDENTLTLFYGFLDQDLDKLKPAHYLDRQISRLGINTLNKCYGSFIVIHLHKLSGRCLLANDALGDFAAHYYQSQNTVFISDLPMALLNKDNIGLNKDRLLHYFALSQPHNNGSFFEAIKQLNPGHYAEIDNNQIKVHNYYQRPDKTHHHSQSVDVVAKQFLQLMQQAISWQTQGQEQLGLMMSGGMDSTFVAANALQANKKISTFSYVFNEMPEADEQHWIDSMQALDLDRHSFTGEPYWPLKPPWHISLNSPVSNPYRHLKNEIYQQAQAKNIKILLSGVFADHLYTGYIYWLVDQLKVQPLNALKSLYKTVKIGGIKTALKQLSPGKWSTAIKPNAPWLNDASKQRLLNKNKQRKAHKSPHPQQYELVFGIATAQSCWLDNEYAFKHKLIVRHPFRDRRVVEFLLSLPAWVLGKHNQPKQLVQTSAKNLLPDTILNRKKTTSLKPLFIKGVLQKELAMVKDLLTAKRCQWPEFVDKERIINMLNNPAHDHKDCDYMILWQCISFELWVIHIKKEIENGA